MTAKVLIIDDSQLVHAMLDDALADEDIENVHAFDAEEGYWYAKRTQPDAILLDVRMPGTSGFELCKMLKGDTETSQIPVIFLSSIQDSPNKVHGLDLGAMDFISKPFEEADLKARVRVALRIKSLVDQLSSIGQVDALTGLRNRLYFDEQLSRQILAWKSHGGDLSLLMLDVDHFKKLNDNYGHLFGDRVLQGISRSIRNSLRASDVACRYGGEEIVVIMPQTDVAHATEIAERVRKSIANLTFNHRGEVVNVTISGGVACTPGIASPRMVAPHDLIHAADEALYKAKSEGRNQIRASSHDEFMAQVEAEIQAADQEARELNAAAQA